MPRPVAGPSGPSPRIVREVAVAAPPELVWPLWTTSAGVRAQRTFAVLDLGWPVSG